MPLTSELVTKVTADTAQFEAAMIRADRLADKFTDGIVKGGKLAGAAFLAVSAAAGTLFTAISKVADKYSDVYDNAQKIGINSQKLGELSLAAGQAGVSSETLTKALLKMNLTLGQAAGGSKKAQDAFTSIGLSFRELASLSPDERYKKISSAVQGLGSETEKVAALTRIYGKAGSEQLALVNAGVDQQVEKFKQLGLVLSDSQQATLDTFSETKNLAEQMASSQFEKFAAGAAKPLTEMLEQLINVEKGFKGAEDAGESFGRSSVVAINGVISVLGTVGSAFSTVGKGIGEGIAAAQVTGEGFIARLQRKSEETMAKQFGASGLTNFGLNTNAASGSAIPPQALASSIPSIGDSFGKMTPAFESATKAADKFAKVVDKVSDDMITNGIKSSDGTSAQIQRILAGRDSKPIAVDAEFDSLAADLVDFSQRSSGSMENKRYQENALLRLNSIANLSGQMGEDPTAMREAIKQLSAFVQKQQGKNDVQKLDITVKPTPYAQIEWATSPAGVALTGAQVGAYLNSQASGFSGS